MHKIIRNIGKVLKILGMNLTEIPLWSHKCPPYKGNGSSPSPPLLAT